MENNKYDYYHGNREMESFLFYRLPKKLFQSMDYVTLPSDAKLLYAFMLDRTAISWKNGWIDEHNNVYIYFTVEDATRYLGVSPGKVSRLMSMLDDKRGCGLIHRKRQGQGKPSKIYVKDIHSGEEEFINIYTMHSDTDFSNLQI